MDLAGKVALITGAGSGLGAALADVLTESGASVVAADIKPDRAALVANAALTEGRSARPLSLDVADPDAVADAVDTVVRDYGRLDILVNSAGIDRTAPLDALTTSDWDGIVAVNLSGPFYLMQAVFPVMKRQGCGQIVNIASTAAKRAWSNAAAYHASKWGLLGLSHAAHVEGRPYGIKVTAVVAGGMRTPFLLDRFPDLDPTTLQDPRRVAEAIRFILCQPAETVIPELTVLPTRETSWP